MVESRTKAWEDRHTPEEHRTCSIGQITTQDSQRRVRAVQFVICTSTMHEETSRYHCLGGLRALQQAGVNPDSVSFSLSVPVATAVGYGITPQVPSSWFL